MNMASNINQGKAVNNVRRGRGSASSSRSRGGYGRRFYGNNWYRRKNDEPRENAITVPIFNDAANNTTHSVYPVSMNAQSSSEVPLSFQIRIQKESDQYPGWEFYFPQEEFKSATLLKRKIDAIKEHFSRFLENYNLDEIKQLCWFHFDVQSIINDQILISKWLTFNKDLTETPELTLNIIGCAMARLLSEKFPHTDLKSNSKLIRARPKNFEPVVNLKAIKGNNYDRLITFRGTVTRVGGAEVIQTWIAFTCDACKSEQAVKQPQGICTFPNKCIGSCKKRSNFIPQFYSPYSICVAFQKIQIQETIRGQKYEQARVPRSIDAELTQDLVETVCPGDDITLTGILKVRPQEDNFHSKQMASTFKMYVKAVAITKSKSVNPSTTASGLIEFSEKDLEAINAIKTEQCPFKLIVQSLCPGIFGHEMIKAGLILGLIGASVSDENKKRSQLHVLVVGDPGVGKSQMLQACVEISPRGVFVCGTGNSTAGLTVSVRKDKNRSNDSALEAGALVLADQGVCCIDEFDKMSSNHHALLEVMEQQVVSVAKAGVLCSLPARTSILAAANPVAGHYDRSRTVAENLKMGGPLLSRFDLVFILLDKHDQEFDSMLTDHIVGLQKKKKENYCRNTSATINETSILYSSQSDEKLLMRLKLNRGETLDLLPPSVTRKYIAYARQNCNPKLSTEAVAELKKFYLELRSTSVGMDSIPVTARQLEALIRLTQARARVELLEVATKQHALDVIEIMKFSLLDVFTTSTGGLMFERNIMGSGMSQTKQAKKFLEMLQRRSATLNKTIFDLKELKEIAVHLGMSSNVLNVIDSLNNQGYILKKGQSIYQFIPN